jgi:hypothetical protein
MWGDVHWARPWTGESSSPPRACKLLDGTDSEQIVKLDRSEIIIIKSEVMLIFVILYGGQPERLDIPLVRNCISICQGTQYRPLGELGRPISNRQQGSSPELQLFSSMICTINGSGLLQVVAWASRRSTNRAPSASTPQQKKKPNQPHSSISILMLLLFSSLQKWAVDMMECACSTYKQNHPDAHVSLRLFC